MANIQKHTQFEQIELYYTNEAKLSDKQREIAERWELAFSLLQKHKSKKIAALRLIALEEAKGNTLSKAQAYRDLSNAENLFVPLRKYSRDLLRHVLIESAMKDLEDVKKKMKDKKETEKISTSQWLKLMEMKHKIEYRLIELSGLDDDNADIPDFSKLEVHNYQIKLPPHVEKMLNNIISQGVIDATELAETIDTEYTEDDSED